MKIREMHPEDWNDVRRINLEGIATGSQHSSSLPRSMRTGTAVILRIAVWLRKRRVISWDGLHSLPPAAVRFTGALWKSACM